MKFKKNAEGKLVQVNEATGNKIAIDFFLRRDSSGKSEKEKIRKDVEATLKNKLSIYFKGLDGFVEYYGKPNQSSMAEFTVNMTPEILSKAQGGINNAFNYVKRTIEDNFDSKYKLDVYLTKK